MSKNIRIKYSEKLSHDLMDLHGIDVKYELNNIMNEVGMDEVGEKVPVIDSLYYLKNYDDAMYLANFYKSEFELGVARKSLFDYLRVKAEEIKENHCE